MKNVNFAFFGQDEFAVLILKELQTAGFIPSLVITGPDKPVGRKQIMTPPPVKIWADTNAVETRQPEDITGAFISEMQEQGPWNVFVVASYGKILPQDLLNIPEKGTLNVHPSLLPKLRGADPLRSAILKEPHTGVTIMQIDEKMDHGPIIARQEVFFNKWPVDFFTLRDRLANVGGKLLAENLVPWIKGDINAVPQNHGSATYTTKVTKEDGKLDIVSEDQILNWRKYLAYMSWPGTYFLSERNGSPTRLKITEADFVDGKFVVKKVIPEGKSEMLYEDYLRG